MNVHNFESVSRESVETYAVDNNVSMHVAAARLDSPLLKSSAIWSDVRKISISESVRQSSQNLMIGRNNFVKEFSQSIAKTIKFPVNTVYLHALGCIASAMTKAFTFKYGHENKAVNLYIVSAQPPSTGKSGVNSILSDPIMEAYEDINEENKKIRRKAQREVAKAEKDLAKGSKDDFEEIEIMDRLENAEKVLRDTPEWQPIISDTTIEAAEDLASKQTGMFNIISAESESVSVVTGGVYGDDNKSNRQTNYGLLLNAWDNERTATARVTRKGHNGYVRASISVIAQDTSVETILRAGSSGRGLAERFLLLAEPNMLGKRDFSLTEPLRDDLYTDYKALINNIVHEKFISLTIEPEGLAQIAAYRQGIEHDMGDSGKYENNLLTGFMGKADKQIIKLACVLHVIENWSTGGGRSVSVKDDHVIAAISLFGELAKTYIEAADFLGFVGGKSEIIKATDYIEAKAQKGALKIRIRQMVNDLKNVKPFKGTRHMTGKIRDNVLPKLEELNYCVVCEDVIYINPRLK